jgi:hypothetical protein
MARLRGAFDEDSSIDSHQAAGHPGYSLVGNRGVAEADPAFGASTEPHGIAITKGDRLGAVRSGKSHYRSFDPCPLLCRVPHRPNPTKASIRTIGADLTFIPRASAPLRSSGDGGYLTRVRPRSHPVHCGHGIEERGLGPGVGVGEAAGVRRTGHGPVESLCAG